MSAAVNGDPISNSQLSPATEQACSANELGAACEASVVADINAARASEGVPPMTLPPSYNSLTVPQQLLVLANLERIGRGLIPVGGLSAALNATASSAALADADPNPSASNGNALSANWAGGTASPLIADFMWMYDDGLGSGNIDCAYNNQSGCWGHRDDTLYPFSAPLVMGAAYAPATVDGPSLAELFVGGDTATGAGEADALLAPTWATISQSLQIGLSASSVVLPNGVESGHVDVSAPAMDMYVSASITHGSAWQVSPSSCALAAGSSCELTVTGRVGSKGTLTLFGPYGSQTVTLGRQAPTSLRVRLGRTRNASGSTLAVTGRLATSGGSGVAGQIVTLYKHAPGKAGTSVVSRGRTRVGGSVSFRVSPHATTTYILGFAGSPTLAAASTGPAQAHVSRHSSRR